MNQWLRGAVLVRPPFTERTLAQLLRDRGYATGGIVSSYALRRATGLSRGFTFFDESMLSYPESGSEAKESRTSSLDTAPMVAKHWP